MVLTVVDIIGEEKIAACKKIADDIGVKLRVRPFEVNICITGLNMIKLQSVR